VAATANNGKEAVHEYKQHRPHVALLDIQMPIMTGIEAADEILDFDPAAKILYLTTFASDEYIAKALSLGAKGYILKEDYESIVPSLKAVAAGQTVFGSTVVEKLPAIGREPDFKKWGLNEKESELIALVGKGLNNKEIAETMFLSEGTVRNYLSGLLEKLGLRDRTQLAVFYYTAENFTL